MLPSLPGSTKTPGSTAFYLSSHQCQQFPARCIPQKHPVMATPAARLHGRDEMPGPRLGQERTSQGVEMGQSGGQD